VHILVIEDDTRSAEYLIKALRETGYAVDHVRDGREALHLATEETFDLLVIDRMLPGMDGLAVIAALRARGVETPVIVLSALSKVDDRVRGLRAGGDDYITKPYAFVELLARIEALLRRSGPRQPGSKLQVGDLELDLLARTVHRAGKSIDLKPREFQLLEFLMRHADQVVTRTMLLEGVWDYHFDPQTNVVDVHISRLRQAIDKRFDRPMLRTVRGAGYMLTASS